MIVFDDKPIRGQYRVSVLKEVPKEHENLFKRFEYLPEKKKTLLYQTENETVLFLGAKDCKTRFQLELVGAAIYHNVKEWPSGDILIDLSDGFSEEEQNWIASGLELRNWHYDPHKVKTKKTYKTHRYIFEGSGEHYKRHHHLNQGNKLARFVISEPPNLLYPASYAALIKDTLEPLGVKVTILEKCDLVEKKMGGILCIAGGSQHEPRLVTLEYFGADSADEQPYGFVGKGVTFDSGGISIKPAKNMEDMRYDMGGSGVVFGLFKALALNKVKVNAVATLPLVENMPSGSAVKPADIITTLSGQTVEIINTDAEGRVILADALWYIQEQFKPRMVIDLATLTGAISVALGHEFAGLFSNDDALAAAITKSGNTTGEEVWRMPLCEAFDECINSDFADMQNTGAERGAGSSTAAQFLKRYIKDGTPWAHLDIANVTWDKKARELTSRGATGFGVRLLYNFIEEQTGK